MELWLSHTQARAIIQLARDAAPQEVCGLIGGKGAAAREIIPIKNIAEDPFHRFYMDPKEQFLAFKKLEAMELDLIGIYHSHPTSDPIPSETDRRESHYPRTPYIIVSLSQSQPRLQGWYFENGHVEHVELHIGQAPTHPSLTSERLSKAQMAAILLSVLLAFSLLLVVSLSLLPPAPIITPAP